MQDSDDKPWCTPKHRAWCLLCWRRGVFLQTQKGARRGQSVLARPSGLCGTIPAHLTHQDIPMRSVRTTPPPTPHDRGPRPRHRAPPRPAPGPAGLEHPVEHLVEPPGRTPGPTCAAPQIKDAQYPFPSINTTRHLFNVHAGGAGVLPSGAEVMFKSSPDLTPQDTTGCGSVAVPGSTSADT